MEVVVVICFVVLLEIKIVLLLAKEVGERKRKCCVSKTEFKL
jgi:hypothetical protein